MSQESGPSRAPQPEPSEDLTAEGKAGEPITLPIASGPATGYACAWNCRMVWNESRTAPSGRLIHPCDWVVRPADTCE